MGWTWSSRESVLLRFPGLANVPDLVKKWPSLALLASEMKAGGKLPVSQPAGTQDLAPALAAATKAAEAATVAANAAASAAKMVTDIVKAASQKHTT